MAKDMISSANVTIIRLARNARLAFTTIIDEPKVETNIGGSAMAASRVHKVDGVEMEEAEDNIKMYTQGYLQSRFGT